MWIEKFELPDRPYPVTDFLYQDCFEYITEEITEKRLIILQ